MAIHKKFLSYLARRSNSKLQKLKQRYFALNMTSQKRSLNMTKKLPSLQKKAILLSLRANAS
ncbi:hypothetical protein [Helicobacter sp. T3_23-1056]